MRMNSIDIIWKNSPDYVEMATFFACNASAKLDSESMPIAHAQTFSLLPVPVQKVKAKIVSHWLVLL